MTKDNSTSGDAQLSENIVFLFLVKWVLAPTAIKPKRVFSEAW